MTKGGQGRSAQETIVSAWVVIACLLIAVAVIATA